LFGEPWITKSSCFTYFTLGLTNKEILACLAQKHNIIISLRTLKRETSRLNNRNFQMTRELFCDLCIFLRTEIGNYICLICATFNMTLQEFERSNSGRLWTTHYSPSEKILIKLLLSTNRKWYMIYHATTCNLTSRDTERSNWRPRIFLPSFLTIVCI